MNRMEQGAMHGLRIAKPHLCFGRVHVYVDFVRRQINEQRRHRMAIARQQILIRRAHSANDQLIFHRPAIDEQMLMLARAAMKGRQPRKA